MSIADLNALLPLLILACGIVIALLAAAFSKKPKTTFGIALISLAAAFAALFFRSSHAQVTRLLAMDSYSAYYMGLIFASAFAVTVLSRDYLLARKAEHSSEYYLILLLATLGSAIITASTHFASFFLGLEILSVSLYILISYRRADVRSLEAGIKYLALAGTSSAFLLFGMALIYASLGSLDFSGIGRALAERASADKLTYIGTAMLITGIGFKLATAPFHMWSPDIYEGAPAPVTGFIATISKGAMFALLLRLIFSTALLPSSGLFTVLAVLAIASMFIGNLAALRQNNIKRLLAYSSIAHLGYLLVAILAGTELGMSSAAFYLVAYFITTLIAFGVVSLLSTAERDADQMSDYAGLFWKRPMIALMFSASILSLAGIPVTAGFVGKVYLVSAGIGSTLWALVVILVINSVIGLYYYLRVIVAMFTPLPSPTESQQPAAVAWASGSTLAVLSMLLVWLGVYPSPALHLIQSTMGLLGQR
jgi:NADH-quinone oxidoreductase subunit N